jgi:DNA-binding NtrC family response regulator
MHAKILRVSQYPSNVLITGPSGTGKELIARAVHGHSPRAEHPFIPVDCTTISGTFFASRMFGHLKGAFTGADYPAIGCVRAADGGTLFFDEIGELEPDLQAKLLRVLQERAVVPLGGHDSIPVDVRLVAATNRDLKNDVAEGRFRADLFYRLNVIPLESQALCHRPEDIRPLACHYLAELAVRHGTPLKRLTPEALERLAACGWPGNVRQMQNVLEQAVVYGEGELLDLEIIEPLLRDEEFIGPITPHAEFGGAEEFGVEDEYDFGELPIAVPPPEAAPPPTDESWRTMDDVEREHIRATLAHTSYNQSAAARLLKMDRHLLRRKIKKYGLDVSQSMRGRPRNLPR